MGVSRTRRRARLSVVHERRDDAVAERDGGGAAAEELPLRDVRSVGGFVDRVLPIERVESDINLSGIGEGEAGGRKARRLCLRKFYMQGAGDGSESAEGISR